MSITRYRIVLGGLALWFSPSAWFWGRYSNGYRCFGPLEVRA